MYPQYLQHSIDTLPDEILGLILEHTYDEPTKLALVSRRFHDLVLRLPNLWTVVECRSPRSPRWFELALARSGDRELDVTIHNGYALDDDLAEVARHLHRARSLTIFGLSAGDGVERGLGRCLRSLDMTRLRRLELSGGTERIVSGTNLPVSHDWVLPQLEEMRLYQIVGIPIALANLPALTMLTLQLWQTPRLPSRYSWTTLFDMLSSCSGLQHLALYLGRHLQWESIQATDLPMTELWTLKTFRAHVVLRSVIEREVAFDPLFDRLVLPGVENMELVLDIEERREIMLDEVLQVFTRQHVSFPRLRSLEFKLCLREDSITAPTSAFAFQVFFYISPVLRHLTLEYPRGVLWSPLKAYRRNGEGLNAHDDDTVLRIPPLETICFQRCYGSGESAFINIIRSNFWDVFVKPIDEDVKEEARHPLTLKFAGCSHLYDSKEALECAVLDRGLRFEWQDAPMPMSRLMPLQEW
jgi:hypothetical protein